MSDRPSAFHAVCHWFGSIRARHYINGFEFRYKKPTGEMFALCPQTKKAALASGPSLPTRDVRQQICTPRRQPRS